MHEQATLVAFYGEKREPLASLIGDLQEAIARELGTAFTSYAPEQVHATIIGLECTPDDPHLNRNARRLGGDINLLLFAVGRLKAKIVSTLAQDSKYTGFLPVEDFHYPALIEPGGCTN